MSEEQSARLDAQKEPIKKGKPVWKPADVAEVFDKEPGYRYRKARKDPTNLSKKEQEGWETVSAINGNATTTKAGYGRINDGNQLTSVREGTDWVLMRIPEDVAQSRDEYVNGKTDRLTKALRRQAQSDLRKEKTEAHGDISIERKGVRTVIQ